MFADFATSFRRARETAPKFYLLARGSVETWVDRWTSQRVAQRTVLTVVSRLSREALTPRIAEVPVHRANTCPLTTKRSCAVQLHAWLASFGIRHVGVVEPSPVQQEPLDTNHVLQRVDVHPDHNVRL